MMTNWTNTNVNSPDTSLVRLVSGLKMDTFGSSQSGKISSKYFAIWAKNKSLVVQSGIGALVVGFIRIGAVKKSANKNLAMMQT